MECEHASEQIGAWIDRQLSAAEAAPLQAHLATCPECRSAAEALRRQDAQLRRGFQPSREAAERVAAAVIGRLNDDERDRESSPAEAEVTVAKPAVAVGSSPRRDYAALAFAAAAGFLLAILLFPPWDRSAVPVTPNNATSPIATVPPSAESAVARLVVATGDVQVRTAGAAEFDTHTYLEFLACPSDSVVRTGPNIRCEWKTADGCVVRLNGDTQVRFASEGVVEVLSGQIACSSPENASLKVIVPEHRASTTQASAPGASPTGSSTTAFTCQWQSSAIAAVEPGGDVRVTASAGDVALQTPAGAAALKRGETVRLVNGQIVRVPSTDPLLATGWTGALLVRKGYDDPELARRVDELLARMGQSKVSLLYEEEIRALGEHAVLPLLKYVESPLSQSDRARRQAAMRLASDLAPTWAVHDLIRLLADTDPYIRFLAAQSLLRLTGNDQGRPPEKWREDLKDCEPTLNLWRTWLEQEPNRFLPRKPDRQT
jgi:hypothetical protein